jgi:hypothetical protein
MAARLKPRYQVAVTVEGADAQITQQLICILVLVVSSSTLAGAGLSEHKRDAK